MNKFLVLPLFFLFACGTNKVSPSTSDLGAPGGICPENYDPIPLSRPNAVPLASLDLLPVGQYTMSATETYIDVLGKDGFKLHYLEDISSTQLVRKYCSTPINPNETFKAVFSSVWLFTNPVAGGKTYRVRSYELGAEQGRPVFTPQTSTVELQGSFLPILQTYQQYRIFQVDSYMFEIRARFEGAENGKNIKKRFLMRLRRTDI